MGLLAQLKQLFGSSDRLNVRRRYETLDTSPGSTSVVSKVRDKKSGKIYALKVINPLKAAEFESRFKGYGKPTEAEIAKLFRHPNIVETIEHGLTTAEEPYLLMEYLDGSSLQNLITYYAAQLDGRRVALLRQLAEAIRAVHQGKYLHRDVCPQNVISTADNQTIKLIDFGLAIPALPEFLTPRDRAGRDDYMAPELVRQKVTDQRLDVFAFGVTAYQLCTGKLPWDESAATSVARALRRAQDIVQIRPQINPLLARAIGSCLVQDPADRCPSMDEFLKQIREVEHEDDLPAG